MKNENSNEPILRESAASKAETAHLRLKFVTTFYIAIRNSRIFEAENEAAVQSIQNLLEAIRAIIEAEGRFVLKVVHNYMVLNGNRVKADVRMMSCYSFVFAELQRIKMGGIMFEEGISEDDLRKFIYMLGGFEAETQNPYKEFSSKLRVSGVRGIVIEREVEIEEEVISEDVRERSGETYFQSISVAREILTRVQSGKTVNFKQAKRVVQNMIDIAMEEDYFLMSLTAIKNHDEYTFNHSANVCVMSVGFGQKLGLSKVALEALGMGALLHDVGKTVIPREVLNKPGKLIEDEWGLMRRHPTMGVKSLLKNHSPSDLLLYAILIAFEHHQRVDMTGYPHVKEKRQQSFLSKIVALADCYDALTTPRIYRRIALKPPEAFKIMIEESGKAFDAELLKFFILSVGLYPIGSLVKLDTGEMGLVYSANQQSRYIDRPLIKVVSDPSGKLAMNLIDLTETDSAGKFTRNIVDCVTPSEYFEDMGDYLDAL